MSCKCMFTAVVMLICGSTMFVHATAPSQSTPDHRPATITVPNAVASLVRPLLDMRQKGEDEKAGEVLFRLAKMRGAQADEALAVLMCFNLGESQETTDAVIRRGKRMNPYLRKYRNVTPVIPGREYPSSMLRNAESKEDDFDGALRAIKHGWRSTSEGPGF